MTHSRSTFIWKFVPTLQYVQFPWRFLTINIFGFSFAAGFISYGLTKLSDGKPMIIKLINIPFRLFLTAILLASLVILNWSFFKPVREGPVTDVEKFSGEAWRLQQGAGIYDYLPITAVSAPDSQRGDLAEIIEGEGNVLSSDTGSYWILFTGDFLSDSALVRINVFDYPDWKVFIDGNEVSTFTPSTEKWGRIYITAPSGRHQIYAQLVNTWQRTVGNFISLASWLLLLGIVLVKKVKL